MNFWKRKIYYAKEEQKIPKCNKKLINTNIIDR